MTATIVRANATRETVTPNATMTTLASPTLAGTAGLSLWRVALPAGGSGPAHTMSAEQVWTLLAGEASVTVAAATHRLAPGDTIHLPAHLERQIAAITAATFLVCGASDAVATAAAHPAGVVPPWIS